MSMTHPATPTDSFRVMSPLQKPFTVRIFNNRIDSAVQKTLHGRRKWLRAVSRTGRIFNCVALNKSIENYAVI